jgi:ApbE superfamily uncharacterized protein (UPF0280 family)
MSSLPQAMLLPDGNRLHLNHGPIDLIIGAEGGDRETAFSMAKQRFETVLAELVGELEGLKSAFTEQQYKGSVAKRMGSAVAPYAGEIFVTPMAAVAGAVADEMLDAITSSARYDKVYVNNGGDIAFYLRGGQKMKAATPVGMVDIDSRDPVRGIATSGWRGRSHSLGIADAVTVLAETAAEADVAATLIANAVDLPGHPAIERRPAHDIEVHSELEARLVTVAVGDLSLKDVGDALERGTAFAIDCVSNGLIEAAVLSLNNETRVV